jgi:glycosyltransferase involved in cell wall biosynthesis
VPIVWQVLDSRTPALPRRAAMGLVRRWADAVMFNGRAIETMHLDGRPLNVPSFQFTGAVDTERFRPDPAKRAGARQRFGVPAEGLFIGTVANLNPMKGIEYFIRTAGLIYERRPDSWFLISGSRYDTHRDYLADLHQAVARSRVPADRFIWTEEPPDDHYVALDVTLLTSRPRSEGTTTTALESLACEIPVVATDVGAVREVVRDGVTGQVVPADAPDALAAATLGLVSDPEKRRRLGEAGRDEVVTGHSNRVIAGVCERAFQAALQRQRRDSTDN